MKKQDLKNKILDIQKMGTLELESFKEKLCVSDLESEKKELLFKAIAIRESRNHDISLAMIEIEELRECDEFEL